MPQPYVSPARQAAAAEKKARVIDEAIRLLRGSDRVTAVSLESVAKAAGVSRLTVYNQFGSRRGLLEAVLDRIAERAGFHRVREVMALDDPLLALDRLVELMCRAWSSDDSMPTLVAAAAIDPEFMDALAQRIERRRNTLRALARRMAEARLVRETAVGELVDVLDAMTGFAVFESLRARGRSAAAASRLMRNACAAIVRSYAPVVDEA